ncbi:MAG: hypothetical protein ABW157_01560 [Candidatus Thiodiazotropha sp. LLP2]
MNFCNKLAISVILASLAIPINATAQSADQLAAITTLGSINGIALHCNALGETQKIKRVLVATLPKRRQLGELFDYETNKSFLSFINSNNTCPSPQSLVQQVDDALEILKSLYPVK